MEGVEDLCSSARPGEFVEEEGTISPGSAKAFYFTVIPLEVKEFVLTFYLYTQLVTDVVRKTLHVVVSMCLYHQAILESTHLELHCILFSLAFPEKKNREKMKTFQSKFLLSLEFRRKKHFFLSKHKYVIRGEHKLSESAQY